MLKNAPSIYSKSMLELLLKNARAFLKEHLLFNITADIVGLRALYVCANIETQLKSKDAQTSRGKLMMVVASYI